MLYLALCNYKGITIRKKVSIVKITAQEEEYEEMGL